MGSRQLLDAEPEGSGLTDDQTLDLNVFFVLLSGYLVRAAALVVMSAFVDVAHAALRIERTSGSHSQQHYF